MITATAITDMTATPTTFHVFESPELVLAVVFGAALVAAGTGIDALVVDDVGWTFDIEEVVAAGCAAYVFVLVLASLVGTSPLGPTLSPTLVALALCEFG